MITKRRLLAGVHELIFVEEGLVTMYANFSKALLQHADDIDEDKKEKMSELLTRLYRDSLRHKDILDKMASHISENTKHEY